MFSDTEIKLYLATIMKYFFASYNQRMLSAINCSYTPDMLSDFIIFKLPHFYNTFLPLSQKEHIFEKNWMTESVCKSCTSILIYAVVEDIPLDIPAYRVQSFLPKLEDRSHMPISALKLANQGFYFSNGYIKCYVCARSIHFDDVMRGRQPVHMAGCAASPPAQTLHEQLWGKQI